MEASTPSLQQYYQVVCIRMKDAPKFARYLEQVAPIVRRYGGGLERMLLPETIYAEGMTKPDVINVVFYDSREAFAAFNQDPEFQKLVPLRSESIDMVAIGGMPASGQVTQDRLGGRLYALEIARFGSNGAAGYRSYEERAQSTLRRYGYHIERVLTPDATSGLSFAPDIVKVAYFDRPDGMAQLHQDPAHQRLEEELYPSAVAESIWVTAGVHPSMLAAST